MIREPWRQKRRAFGRTRERPFAAPSRGKIGTAMFLNATSPRRSFNIPININLQGARRRQTRDFTRGSGAGQDLDWSRGLDCGAGQRARSLMPVSSVGEDRAVLLGFTMMAFSVLMFFVVSMTVVKPFVFSKWEEQSDCVLVQTDLLSEWVDCRGVSTVPCLRVTVNLTGSNQTAFLHFDEESVLLVPQCFYAPKCHMERAELQAEAYRVKETLDARLGSDSPCFADRAGHPGSVLLNRKYTRRAAALALLWPSLMLGGGALLVGLVKLTQCLAHLATEVRSRAAGARLSARHAQGRLYRLLRRSSMQTPP